MARERRALAADEPIGEGFAALLADAPVRRLTASQLLVSSATFLQTAAVGKLVFDVRHSELDLGLLGLAEFLPAALLVLITGPIADRYDRRRVALLAMTGELACFVFLAAFALTEPTVVWPMFVVAFTFGVARAFANPAVRSMPPMVAPTGALHRVIALNTAMMTSAIIVGPGISGLLYAIHPSVAFLTSCVLLGAGMLVVSVLTFRRQPDPPAPGSRPSVQAALEGLRFVRRNRIVLAAITLDLFAVLFGGAVALLPAIAENRLHVGVVAYGFLRAAAGIGAALMAIFLAVRPLNRRIGPTLLVVVGLFGVGTIVLGATRDYTVAFAAVVALSAADMVSMYIRGTLIPLVTPDEMRGRVFAVEAVFIGASNELGAFESGVAAAWLGIAVAVVGGGVATLGVVVVAAVAFPELRAVDRFSDLEHQLAGPAPPTAVDGH